MDDIKTKNNNGLCYIQLDGLKLGDVYTYLSSTGVQRHYVISFLHKCMKIPLATILFPDGYSEQIKTEEVKKDRFVKNIKYWNLIATEYKDEANMYL